MTTPWGTRLFANDAGQSDPAGGIDTSVWPLTTAFVSLAEFRNHHGRNAIEHLYSIASLTGFAGAGFRGGFRGGGFRGRGFRGDRFGRGGFDDGFFFGSFGAPFFYPYPYYGYYPYGYYPYGYGY